LLLLDYIKLSILVEAGRLSVKRDSEALSIEGNALAEAMTGTVQFDVSSSAPTSLYSHLNQRFKYLKIE